MDIYAHTIEIGEKLRLENSFTRAARADLEETERLYLEELKPCEGVLPEGQEEQGERERGKPHPARCARHLSTWRGF